VDELHDGARHHGLAAGDMRGDRGEADAGKAVECGKGGEESARPGDMHRPSRPVADDQ
jgi:hypothetical protein